MHEEESGRHAQPEGLAAGHVRGEQAMLHNVSLVIHSHTLQSAPSSHDRDHLQSLLLIWLCGCEMIVDVATRTRR
eukprot:757845-Hanusia_phi.AAC.3